tara:strand:- start:30 stop:284 length:255 start_codon:yes stop_codon:yes gene_type:complete
MVKKQSQIQMAKIIPFPTVKEGDKLREQMTELESEIKLRLDELQVINEEVIQLTVAYEEMLYRLCEITGVELPSNMDWSEPPEE